MLGAIGLLWSTPLVYPLRLLVVFFHELSHALMALATGGSVLRIELSAMEGGVAYTTGGSRFLTLNAGYLGSLLWGGAILWAAAHLRGGRILSGLLAAILLLVCLTWVRPLLSFGVLFCLLAGAGLVWVAARLDHHANDTLLRLIGLTSLLYAPLDILDDAVLRHGHPSDARMLAELTLVPTLVWGVVWCGLSVVMAWWFLREAARAKG
jgi:type IV secretory pathway TrbD component